MASTYPSGSHPSLTRRYSRPDPCLCPRVRLPWSSEISFARQDRQNRTNSTNSDAESRLGTLISTRSLPDPRVQDQRYDQAVQTDDLAVNTPSPIESRSQRCLLRIYEAIRQEMGGDSRENEDEDHRDEHPRFV